MKKGLIITLSALAVIALIIILARGYIAKAVFMGKVDDLAGKIPPKYAEYYEEELRYTASTFWDFYREGVVSKNDLNDVVDRMDSLNRNDTLTKDQTFELIDYMSGIYTEASKERDKKVSREKRAEEAGRDSVRIKLR